MAHNDGPKYEQYWRLAQWFFGSPEAVERFIRAHGTLEDLEKHHLKVVAIVEREERRRWLRETLWLFFKVFAAIGAGLAAMGAGAAAIRTLLAALGGS